MKRQQDETVQRHGTTDKHSAVERHGAGDRHGATVITTAYSGVSKEQAARQRRYAITMAFRTACFIGLFFVPGGWRWVLLAGAVFLPYIAVLFANQAAPRPQVVAADQAEAVDLSGHAPIGQFQTITVEPDETDDRPAPPGRHR